MKIVLKEKQSISNNENFEKMDFQENQIERQMILSDSYIQENEFFSINENKKREVSEESELILFGNPKAKSRKIVLQEEEINLPKVRKIVKSRPLEIKEIHAKIETPIKEEIPVEEIHAKIETPIKEVYIKEKNSIFEEKFIKDSLKSLITSHDENSVFMHKVEEKISAIEKKLLVLEEKIDLILFSGQTIKNKIEKTTLVIDSLSNNELKVNKEEPIVQKVQETKETISTIERESSIKKDFSTTKKTR